MVSFHIFTVHFITELPIAYGMILYLVAILINRIEGYSLTPVLVKVHSHSKSGGSI